MQNQIKMVEGDFRRRSRRIQQQSLFVLEILFPDIYWVCYMYINIWTCHWQDIITHELESCPNQPCCFSTKAGHNWWELIWTTQYSLGFIIMNYNHRQEPTARYGCKNEAMIQHKKKSFPCIIAKGARPFIPHCQNEHTLLSMIVPTLIDGAGLKFSVSGLIIHLAFSCIISMNFTTEQV